MPSRCPCGYTGCTHDIVYCSRCRNGYEIGMRQFWGYRRVCPSCHFDYLCGRSWHDLEDASHDLDQFIKTLKLFRDNIDTLDSIGLKISTFARFSE